MNNALSAMGKSLGMFEMTRNEMYRQLPKPSRQAEFEHIVTNFIFDQEERIKQLKDYMQVIAEEFMEFSSEFTRRLKENENKPRKIEKSQSIRTPRYFQLIPSNPSQPRKNTFGFNPGKRANQSHQNPSNFLTVQPPTQSDPTFVDNDPIERDPSPHYSFTHVESNRMFNPEGKSHDLSLNGSQGLQI
ncbi:hypothetical protein Tco_0243688 [Tanacetum coccineum]